MRAILLVAIWFALSACSSTKTAWKVVQSDLYQVTSYSDGQSPIADESYRPYFLVKKVIGSPDSAAFANVVQYQLFWCDNPSTCNERDYLLQIVEFADSSEGSRASFVSGAQCTIIRHLLSDGGIVIHADTYIADQFEHEECEAGVSGSLPATFSQTSRKIIVGKLVPRMGDEA